MKTMLIATAALAVTALGVQGAAAQSLTQPEVYGSLGAGKTSNNKTDSDLESLNGRVGAKLTPHFGVEGELALGTKSDVTQSGKYKLTNRKAAYAVGYLPVHEKIDLIGRVGISDTKLKNHANTPDVEDGQAFDYGVGAQYHFNSAYSVRGDYTRSEFKEGHGDADNVNISVVRKF
ncbi:MAG: porin family protein [Asticcacaulis sp.]